MGKQEARFYRHLAPTIDVRALEDPAHLHVRYEDPAVRDVSPEVAWIHAPRPSEPGVELPPNMGQVMLGRGIEEQADALGESCVAV